MLDWFVSNLWPGHPHTLWTWTFCVAILVAFYLNRFFLWYKYHELFNSILSRNNWYTINKYSTPNLNSSTPRIISFCQMLWFFFIQIKSETWQVTRILQNKWRHLGKMLCSLAGAQSISILNFPPPLVKGIEIVGHIALVIGIHSVDGARTNGQIQKEKTQCTG